MPVPKRVPPTLPRRTLLTGAGAAVALGAVGLFAPPALTPLVARPPDLRDLWTELLTARARLDPTNARIRHHLEAEENSVRIAVRSMDHAQVGSVFSGYAFDGESSSSLTGTAKRLATMSRAWVTPASRWSGRDDLRERIVDGFTMLVESAYNAGVQPYENWWDWEVGTPRELADVMCIMRRELPEQTLRAAGEAIRAFIPDPTYSEQMNYPTTGANRIDTSQGVLVAALVEGDLDRVRECVTALPAAWEIVEKADGFYRDGGFIQHIDVPYTGSYGVELLRHAAPLLSLIEGTELDDIDRAPLWDLIDEAYLPVMVSGHVLDLVRGRAVSRMSTNGSTGGRATLAAIAELASTAPAERRDGWFTLFREWEAKNSSVDLFRGADIPGAVALAAVEHGPDATAPTQRSTYFASMDRLVHRAPGWTAAVAMCSNRIAAYEATEVENIWGSRTGNSMRYLFVDDAPEPFDDHFWSTLDYSRPPGTTNHATAHEPRPTRGSDSNVPQNEWTGGMVHDAYSVAAMHQTGLDGDAPECRRLTVATADRLIELVSDITSEHRAFTTVENRMFPAGVSSDLVIDGEQIRDETSIENPAWAHLDGVAGYIFLTEGNLTSSVTTRAGSTERVERAVADIGLGEGVRRRWATIDLSHDQSDRAAAWMVLPGVSQSAVREEAQATSSSRTPGVVRNDAAGQIVAVNETLTVAAAWRSLVVPVGQQIELECPHALLVLAERRERGLFLRVAEPTQQRAVSRFRLSGRWEITELSGIADGAVELAQQGGMTELIAETEGRGGRSFTLTMREV